MKQVTKALNLGLFAFLCALSRANADTLFSYTRELTGMYLVSNTFPDFTLSFAIQTNVNSSDLIPLFEVHWTTNDIGAMLTATSATNSRFDIFAAKMTDGNTNDLYYTLSLPSVTALWSFDEPSAYFNGETGSPADLQGNQIDSISLKLNSLSLSSGTPEDPYVLFSYNLTLSALGQAIPEPTTWSLLALGAVALFGGRHLRRRHLGGLATILLVSALVASSVQAQFTEIDISAQVNADLQKYGTATDNPLGGTQLNIEGVPFGLAELGNNPNTTGVVQPGTTSGGGSGHLGSFNYIFSLPAGTQGTVLYCLINSVWGRPGVNEGSIIVTGTLGETATLSLIEGFNIRDTYNGYYVNSLTDPTVVPTYFLNGIPNTSGYIQTRLDRQQLILPATFSGDTIASISFQGYAQGDPNGSAFLAALIEIIDEEEGRNLVLKLKLGGEYRKRPITNTPKPPAQSSTCGDTSKINNIQ